MKKIFLALYFLLIIITGFAQKPAPKPSSVIPINSKPDMTSVRQARTITPVYNFSNVHICVDRVMNNSLPPKAIIPSAKVPKIKSNGELDQVGTISQPLSGVTNVMWAPGESVTVGFFSDETFVVTDKVKKYVKEWETYANIRFVYLDDVSKAEIKVGFERDGTSWSWVGRNVLVNPSGFKTMNLGWLDSQTSETEFRRVVLHEFGHALGFIHEHQSPAAGIAWDKEKVYAFFGGPPNNWSRATVDNNIFYTYSKTSTNSSTYDPLSIMHYFFPADLTTDGSSFTMNTNLSIIDKNFSRQVYPFPLAPPTANGVLQTGDDCDEIEFTVEYNAVFRTDVEFILEPGRDANNNLINWWKKISVPLIGGTELGLEMQDGHSDTKTTQIIRIDKSKGISFGKAKALGVHTGLNYKWNVLPAILGGCRVRLKWRRDRC